MNSKNFFTLEKHHLTNAPAHISITDKMKFVENVLPMCIQEKHYPNDVIMYAKDDVAIRMFAMCVFTVDLLGVSKDEDWFVRNEETGEFEVSWEKMIQEYDYFDSSRISYQLERIKRTLTPNDICFEIQGEFKVFETLFNSSVYEEVRRLNMIAQSQNTANIVKVEFNSMLDELKSMITKESMENMIEEIQEVQDKLKNFNPLATTVPNEDFNYDTNSKEVFKDKETAEKYTNGKFTILGDKRNKE